MTENQFLYDKYTKNKKFMRGLQTILATVLDEDGREAKRLTGSDYNRGRAELATQLMKWIETETQEESN